VVAIDLNRHKEIFKQLGYDIDESAALLQRTLLLKTLKSELEKKGWSQKMAAEKLGISPQRISEICALKINLFSIDLLIKYLARLGKEVNFTVRNLR
jgi:predicted XRE-type DNA-binding protein